MGVRINAAGEWVYTTSEVGSMMGINANTIRAAATRLFGRTHRCEFTLDEVRKIKAYFDSFSPEQEEMRIKALCDVLKGVE